MKLKNVSRKKDTDNHKGPTLASERKGWMYLDLLLDEAKEILAYVDINLRYLHVNKAHADWLGLQKNDFTGRYVSETLDDQTFKLLLPQFIKAFDGEHIYYTYQRNSAFIEVELIPKYKNPTEIIRVVAKSSKFITIEPIQTLAGAKPHPTSAILENTMDDIIRQSVIGSVIFEIIIFYLRFNRIN